MNYYEHDDLQFEALKGVDTHDKLEHEHEEVFLKETLINVEIKNKKIFIGVEQ